ncbi:MAG: PBP1A family penicillin-binding protein [bacterium]
MNIFFKTFLITIIFISSFLTGAFLYLYENQTTDFSSLQNYDPGKPSIVLDDEGKELFRFDLDKRAPVTFDKLPPVLVKAFVATEDHNFFNHCGISFKGILRSILVNLYKRQKVQGASTITQQLARMMFLYYDKTFLRKFQEMFLALQIEKQFSKEKILELYVNNVFFGQGIYGVQAACKRFWNKSVTEIDLEQAAVLASVTRSAKIYSPLNSTFMSQKRRDLVLHSMLKLNFITHEEYQQAIKKELSINDFLSGNPIRLYLKEWIRNWAENNWGKDILYKKGLKIKTTINSKMQEVAENVMSQSIKKLRENLEPELNGGLISIESNTGKIKASIGGLDFKESQFNRSFQAVRQIGSAFKPIIYTTALQNGMKMNDIEIDEPFELPIDQENVWRPKNWTNRFEGPMTLLKALSFSNNIITIKVFLKTGAKKIIELAKKFGIKRGLQPYPSLALGVAESTVEECAAAFNVFANSGEYVKPYLFEWVKNQWDKKIWQNEEARHNILDLKTNSKMINALSYRMKRARNYFGAQNWINCESIGKSGSTNGASSVWFVGSTPQFTTAVYLGRDDNKPMGKSVFASSTSLPVWYSFNKQIDTTKKHFYIDPNLKEIIVDWNTGLPLKDKMENSAVTILEG